MSCPAPHQYRKLKGDCLCSKLVLVVPRSGGVGDDDGVAVKCVVTEVQQAPIGCVAERRGSK